MVRVDNQRLGSSLQGVMQVIVPVPRVRYDYLLLEEQYFSAQTVLAAVIVVVRVIVCKKLLPARSYY